jgi:hypothetical protein
MSDNLEDLPNIGKVTADRLRAAGAELKRDAHRVPS